MFLEFRPGSIEDPSLRLLTEPDETAKLKLLIRSWSSIRRQYHARKVP